MDFHKAKIKRFDLNTMAFNNEQTYILLCDTRLVKNAKTSADASRYSRVPNVLFIITVLEERLYSTTYERHTFQMASCNLIGS